MPSVAITDLLNLARAPFAHDALGCPEGSGWVVSDLRSTSAEVTNSDRLADLACVLVAMGAPTHPLAAAFDVVVSDEAAATEVTTAIDGSPIASTALALLLRGGDRRTVAEGLIAESATYSTLQDGPEHRAWLGTRAPAAVRHETEPAIRVTRVGDTLRITLNRPHVRNAYGAAMRDELIEALTIATVDESLQVVIAAEGSAFCSGGDLREFGTRADPAMAHLLRLARSAGRAMHTLRARTTVMVHGACVGAGVELPAFASRVLARADATFRLPEVSMGLVPGAGGTVSVARRVGRHRAAWLAITGATIDASTAVDWGLVDEVT